MSRLIDLSLPVVDGGGRLGIQTKFEIVYSFEKEGWQGSVFRMFAHMGTHVDAPLHFLRGGESVDRVAPERICGRGVLFDLSGKQGSEAITDADLEAQDQDNELREGDIAILRTDWTDKHWGTPKFFGDSPYLTPEAANWLVRKKVKAIVYDFAEEYVVRKSGFTGPECVIHHIVMGNGIYNIEYVTNLRAITKRVVTIMALPLKLVGVDAAPARVIAIEE